MKTIWKVPIQISDEQQIAIPKDSEILCVQVQYGTPCLWFLCDPQEPNHVKTIRVFGTGHPVVEKLVGRYIGTFQQPPFVWHVFEGA